MILVSRKKKEGMGKKKGKIALPLEGRKGLLGWTFDGRGGVVA